MSRVHLGDVAIEHKETCKEDKSMYPIVGLEHLTPEQITLQNWDLNTENTFTKVFRKGNILFGRRRAYLKKAAVAPFDGICSGDITVIEAKEDKIVPELLPFVIQNDDLFDFAVGKSAGSLSPRVKWTHLQNYEFELPTKEKQRELAKVLWAIEDTRKSYQELIKRTDELVKSQFIELLNTAESEEDLIKHVNVLYGYPFNSKMFNTDGNGLPLIRVRDINSGFSDTFTTEIADEQYIVENGDCLVGMDGNFEIVKWKHGKALLNQRTCKLTPIDIKREFMLHYMRLKLKELESVANSTTVKHLSAKDISKMKIPAVDLLRQEEFEKFSLQSDKSKFELNRALDELTATYKQIIKDNLG